MEDWVVAVVALGGTLAFFTVVHLPKWVRAHQDRGEVWPFRSIGPAANGPKT